MPYAVCSVSYQPAPIPSSTRPPDMSSTSATDTANGPGRRNVALRVRAVSFERHTDDEIVERVLVVVARCERRTELVTVLAGIADARAARQALVPELILLGARRVEARGRSVDDVDRAVVRRL